LWAGGAPAAEALTNNDGAMPFGGRVAVLGITALMAVCLMASCGNGPAVDQRSAGRAVRTSTTTTTTTAPPTTTSSTRPGIPVPNVIGLKIAAAHSALGTAGFPSVRLNTPCNLGTLASQSVVASLSIPGKGADARVGALPLSPGTLVAPGTRIGITWSGCYGDASEVPAVVGLTLGAARRFIHAEGLNWACFSVGRAPPSTSTSLPAADASTTTTRAPETTTTRAPETTTTRAPETTTTVKVVQTVLTQTPAAHTTLRPGATVTLTMHHCPQ
jgi:beta-lactam-binding protein with PASTA domain